MNAPCFVFTWFSLKVFVKHFKHIFCRKQTLLFVIHLVKNRTFPKTTTGCDSLFLVNPLIFPINDSDGVYGRACFHPHAVTESVFSKASDLYYNLLFW